jgi:RNA polymerase sigma-70 factor, ECF subfamily
MPAVMAAYDFDEIYDLHKERIWRLAGRYAARQLDREDLFQEVFLSVYRALPKFRGESALETWLYRITVNTALNFLKKRERYRKLRETLTGFRLFEAAENDRLESDALHLPLQKLNPRQRLVLIMADVEERKLEEISALLKIPLGTVKSNLNRARELIKKELEKDGGL